MYVGPAKLEAGRAQTRSLCAHIQAIHFPMTSLGIPDSCHSPWVAAAAAAAPRPPSLKSSAGSFVLDPLLRDVINSAAHVLLIGTYRHHNCPTITTHNFADAVVRLSTLKLANS